jgi:hypothetical protein
VTPEAALKQTFKDGNYYNGPVSELVKRLEYVRQQLAVLEAMPGDMPAHRARQKRKMIAKFERAIRGRLAWHKAELQKAIDAGFTPAEEYEPRKRTIKTGTTHVN